MPGDDWQKFANLRLLYGYMFAQPGKKLLFQGGEFAQWKEWKHDHSLDWHQRPFPPHAGHGAVGERPEQAVPAEPAMHQGDCHAGGFEWVDASDAAASICRFLRRGDDGTSVLVVCNFTPVVRHDYRVGVPYGGYWREIAQLGRDGVLGERPGERRRGDGRQRVVERPAVLGESDAAAAGDAVLQGAGVGAPTALLKRNTCESAPRSPRTGPASACS